MGKWGVSLEIDLPSLARSTIDDRRVRAAITPLFSDRSFKQEFGKRIIDEIVKRTESGVDKNGSSFTPYSDSYKKSTIFKIYKGSKRTPDLHLSGEMLADMDILKMTKTSVTIGFPGSEQEAKAHGHINGSNNLPRRDFFGLPKEIQGKILKETVKDFADSRTVFEIAGQTPQEIVDEFL